MKLIRQAPSLSLKKNAFPFQKDAFNLIKDKEYFAIFHEQGLGKTKIAIDLIYYWLQHKLIDSALIITKNSLVSNWTEELDFHGNINPLILSSNKSLNSQRMALPGYIYLCNYEAVRSNLESFKRFIKFRKVGIILDESTQIKTPTSKITKALHEIAENTYKRIIMTGTPLSNRPYDIWSQIYFLDFGERLGKDFESFKENYDLSNELSKDYGGRIIFENNLKLLNSKLKDCTVRETKKTAGIELPGRRFIAEVIEMEQSQRILYTKLQEELSAQVLKDNKLVNENVDAILKRLIRLLQVCSNPNLVDESYTKIPPKFEATKKITDKATNENSKSIIWTNFVDNVNKICNYFENKNIVGISGDLNPQERNSLISKFRKNDDIKILVATPGVAREGLTLVEANYSIFFDRNFSLENYLQAQDRIYRISQTKDCYIYKLIHHKSIDEWVDALLDAKEVAARYGQGDINEQEFKNRINYDFAEILKDILKTSHTT
jgi:SNF2 family DNA or RNA helicase